MTQLTEGRNERIISFRGIQIVSFHGYSPVAEQGFFSLLFIKMETLEFDDK